MTLIIGLIMLLLLTIMGVVAFTNTTTSQEIVGNQTDRNISFQSAESVGKEVLETIKSDRGKLTGTGYYPTPLSQGGTTSFWTQGDGADVAASACKTATKFGWKNCSASVTKYKNNANAGQYAIELIKAEVNGTDTDYTYRITTRSTGGSGIADVVLQIMHQCTVSAASPNCQ